MSTDMSPLPSGRPGPVAGLAPMPAVPSGGGPGRVRRGRLALGMAVPAAAEALVIAASIAVSGLRPGSGQQAFLVTQLLGIAGCAAVWWRARARGDRSLVRGLAIGLAIVAGAVAVFAAAEVVVAILVWSHPG